MSPEPARARTGEGVAGRLSSARDAIARGGEGQEQTLFTRRDDCAAPQQPVRRSGPLPASSPLLEGGIDKYGDTCHLADTLTVRIYISPVRTHAAGLRRWQ